MIGSSLLAWAAYQKMQANRAVNWPETNAVWTARAPKEVSVSTHDDHDRQHLKREIVYEVWVNISYKVNEKTYNHPVGHSFATLDAAKSFAASVPGTRPLRYDPSDPGRYSTTPGKVEVDKYVVYSLIFLLPGLFLLLAVRSGYGGLRWAWSPKEP